jgi:hypothetical protein
MTWGNKRLLKDDDNYNDEEQEDEDDKSWETMLLIYQFPD